MTVSRRSLVLDYLWWLGIVYALFLSLHPFLIGCDCSDIGPTHTCGIVQYYATIGAVLWMVLLPLGLWLYRGRENASIFLLIVVFVQLLCTMVLLYVPDIFGDAVLNFAITAALTLPVFPFVGLTKLVGSGDSFYTVLFLYLLLIAAYGIYLYRRERQK